MNRPPSWLELFVENIVSFAPSQEIIGAGPQLEAVAVE